MMQHSKETVQQKAQLEAEIRKLEKRDKQVSFAISSGIVVLLLFFSMFWMAFQGSVPPIEEPQWKTVGRIDFGFDNKGRKAVNNFEKPSPTPADRPKTKPKPEKTETQPKEVVSNPPPKTNTSNTTSDNKVQESTQETPAKPDNNTKPTPKTDNKSNENSNNPNKSDTREETSDSPKNGGSDHGDSNQLGNRGNPKSPVLDDNGMFQFGDGIGGEGGRSPLDLPLPKYNIQKEGRITYTFVIAPSGEVVFVKPHSTPHMDLADIGKDAIKKWRFTEVDPSQGNLKTTVTITFRLK